MKKMIRALLLAALLIAPTPHSQAAPAWQAKVAAPVLQQAAAGPAEFIVLLEQQADLSGAQRLQTKAEKGRYVYEQLTGLAARTQPPVIAAIQDLQRDNPGQVEYRPYWVANMIWVRGGPDALAALAQRRDVRRIAANPQVQLERPPTVRLAEAERESPQAVEWSLVKVQAPEVWAKGYTGQGVVIGGQDTGYYWSHPALRSKYRGWDGSSANHNYSWHDAIHSGWSNCGVNSPVPCDDTGHGTHTLGTMVGDDGGANQIGMAPGAKWIGCRNMRQGVGSPATYAECYQWFIAPTDLNGGFPRPDLAPDVINNSWSCRPPDVGCETLSLLGVVEAVRAAGILTVHSAGNEGPSCGTIAAPAGIYDASFTVGATDENDIIAGFSSRGPVLVDGSGRLKPDISAPGTNIRSSVPGSGYGYNFGTSMAAPHVAGLAALLIDAQPSLRGNVDAIEDAIRSTALERTTDQLCGTISGSEVPNNTYGWGRINALAAVEAVEHDIEVVKTAQPLLYALDSEVVFTLRVSHSHPTETALNVAVHDTLPSGLDFVSATEPYIYDGSTIAWTLATLAPGETVSLQITARINAGAGWVLSNHEYGAQSDNIPAYGFPPVKIFSRSGARFLPLLVP